MELKSSKTTDISVLVQRKISVFKMSQCKQSLPPYQWVTCSRDGNPITLSIAVWVMKAWVVPENLIRLTFLVYLLNFT